MEESHLLAAGYVESLLEGIIDRLMIFEAPRAGKSRMASVAAPSHYLGRHPNREVMQAGHSVDLSREFGRETRDTLIQPCYQELFPGVVLHPDSKAAGRWHTSKGGGYHAIGVDSGIAGKGYNLGIIDDPLSEQNARSKAAQKKVMTWYGGGFYTRQAPDVSGILAMGTRWDKGDLFGQLMGLMNSGEEHADDWTVLKIPALIDADMADTLNELRDDPLLKDPRFPGRPKYVAGASFAPRRWPREKLLRRKANISSTDWEALYQQEPTVGEGNILKRAWWRKWPHAAPPKVQYVVQVYDTAFETEEENDFSARTTWGIFDEPDTRQSKEGIELPTACVILLERMNRRLSFPDLRREAHESRKLYKPDKILIEKKASGHSLIQELRRNRLPILPILVNKNADKITRAHAASGVLEHGFVWYMDRQWATEVIDQCAEFPKAEHDDLVDTCVITWLWLRRMFHLRHATETDEEIKGVDLMRRLYG